MKTFFLNSSREKNLHFTRFHAYFLTLPLLIIPKLAFHRQDPTKSRILASKLKLACKQKGGKRKLFIQWGFCQELRLLVLASRSISRSLLARNPLSCGLSSISLLLRTRTDERKEESEKNPKGKGEMKRRKKKEGGGKRRKNREKAAAISIHSVLAYDFSLYS